MAETRVHRILDEVGVAGLPRGLRHALGEDRPARRLPDGVRLRLLGRGDRHRRAGPGAADPDRDDRPGPADLHERADPHHRRRRHRLRQSAERPPDGRRADRRRGRRLLPGGPGLAEEVRPHARQAGDRPSTTTSRRSARRSTPAATATSSSSPGPTPWRSAGLDEAIARVEAAPGVGADASFVEAPASLEDLEEIGRRSPAPNVANMIEGGRTPVLPREQLAELGFQLILYPLDGPVRRGPRDGRDVPQAQGRRHDPRARPAG